MEGGLTEQTRHHSGWATCLWCLECSLVVVICGHWSPSMLQRQRNKYPRFTKDEVYLKTKILSQINAFLGLLWPSCYLTYKRFDVDGLAKLNRAPPIHRHSTSTPSESDPRFVSSIRDIFSFLYRFPQASLSATCEKKSVSDAILDRQLLERVDIHLLTDQMA